MIPKDDANQIIQMLAQGLSNIQVQSDQKEFVLLDLSNDIQAEGSDEKYYTVGPLIISRDAEKVQNLRKQLREIINRELGLQ